MRITKNKYIKNFNEVSLRGVLKTKNAHSYNSVLSVCVLKHVLESILSRSSFLMKLRNYYRVLVINTLIRSSVYGPTKIIINKNK